MAEAVGIRGIGLEDPAEVTDGIAAAFAHAGPVLIDAVVNRTELAMPPSITLEMAKGFTLYMAKAIITGRGDEVIDLATSTEIAGRIDEVRVNVELPAGSDKSARGNRICVHADRFFELG